MEIEKIKKQLNNETSGGGVFGIYQDIIDKNNNVILKGFRDTNERIGLMAIQEKQIENSYFLDIGCNIGAFCKYYKDRGAKYCVGIDINKTFIEVAKQISPDSFFICDRIENINLSTRNEKIGIIKYDYIFLFAMWDYLDSDVLLQFINKIKHDNTIMFFEGHADGCGRIKNDIQYQGKILKNWEYVINNVIKPKKYELLGFTDNNKRPFYKLYL